MSSDQGNRRSWRDREAADADEMNALAEFYGRPNPKLAATE
jgi:hypothetical protein